MKLVLVEWIDANSGKGWQPLDQIEDQAGPVHCRSVGWLVADRNGVKTLVPHISGEKNGNLRLCGAGEISILDKSITRMRVLAKR
jgi:hypothetical protein